MTPLDRAKAALNNAQAAAELAQKKLDIELRTYREKHSKALDASRRKAWELQCDAARLELAEAGITPMETIVQDIKGDPQ